MTLRSPLTFFLLVFIFVSLSSTNAEARRFKKNATVRIGIALDGPLDDKGVPFALLKKEILDLTQGEFDVQFPVDKIEHADWTSVGATRIINLLLADPEVDIIITIGVITSDEVASRKELKKPMIAGFVIDPEFQDLPLKNGKSGKKNLNYLTQSWSFDRDLQAFQEIVEFDSIIILANASFAKAIPHLDERMVEVAASVGIDVNFVPVGFSVPDALAQIPDDAQAVYIGPMFHLSLAQQQALFDGIIERKLPSFAYLGYYDVERGALAGLLPKTFLLLYWRRIALNIQRILLGDDPGTFSVSVILGENLVINMATARAINLWPSWSVLTEAELLHQERTDIDRKLSLESVMIEALEGNVDLAVAKEAVLIGSEEIDISRAALLPRLDFSTTARVIDADRAEASFGSQSEFLFNGELTLTQVIYSEQAWAGLDIQENLQQAREFEFETVRLDVVHAASIAYLNLLRAKTYEQLQGQNLKVSRSNLELARIRVRLGSTNKAEVFRWESQIANDRIAVIDALSKRNQAAIYVNRMLHRPLEELFLTAETMDSDFNLLVGHEKVATLLADPWTFKIFRKFMVDEAIRNSPEILQLEAAIQAQTRVLESAERAYWVPTVALQGSVTQRFYRAGEGSEAVSLMPGVEMTEADSLNWFVGLTLSLPLFVGGSKWSKEDKAATELGKLELQRESVSEIIGQRIDSNLYELGSSWAAIGLSRQSADAAFKNLKLVTDAYGVGAVSILTLLDAQTAYLNAELMAANAIYDFLIEWIDVQRSVGLFIILMSDTEKASFFERAASCISNAREELKDN